MTSQWADSVSNHQPHHCLISRLFGCWSTKTSKLRVTGLCAGNSPWTGEFPAQMASYAENVSIWWRHHESAWCARIFHEISCAILNDVTWSAKTRSRSLTNPPGQNGHHLWQTTISNGFFLSDRNSIRISLKFVPYSPISNNSALVQVMAWRRRSDTPLPKPMPT